MITRIKTFLATGAATAGRIYAGDLNAIQDAAASQADFAQTIDLATLRLGEVGLQLVKYGTGEARVTGMLRVDGILRGLGGLYAGTFTTTQRNAIVLPPFGLVILNTTTVRLEWNSGTDTVPVWRAVGSLSSEIHLIDTYANMPAATTVAAGVEFFATDTLGRWRSNATAWTLVGQGRPRVTSANMDAAPFNTPYDGQEVELVDAIDSKYAIYLKYNAGVTDDYKWLAMGGGVSSSDDNQDSWAIDSAEHTLSGVSVTVPRTGLYRMRYALTTYTNASSGTADITILMKNAANVQVGPTRKSLNVGGTLGNDPDRSWTMTDASGVLLTKGDVVTLRLTTNSAANATTQRARHKMLTIDPIRVS